MKAELNYNNETGRTYTIPVTLREVLKHLKKEDLAGEFGIHEQEFNELLDAPDILRAVFGMNYYADSNSMDEEFSLEVFQQLIGEPAKWEMVIRLHPSINWDKITSSIKNLIEEVCPEYENIMKDIKAEFQDWIDEVQKMREEAGEG